MTNLKMKKVLVLSSNVLLTVLLMMRIQVKIHLCVIRLKTATKVLPMKVAKVHDMRRIDRAHELKCHREGFATVSVFHIHAHEQHLGFFNLHFRHARVFSARELALLETLGQLLGIALENLRLAAREREMAISEERNLVAQGLHDSIAQSLNFLNLQVQMLDDSVRNARFDEVAGIVPALHAGVKESYEDVRELLANFRSRLMEDDLRRWLAADGGDPLKREYYLPAFVDRMAKAGAVRVTALETASRWYGVTYQADAENVRRALAALHAAGEYPRLR